MLQDDDEGKDKGTLIKFIKKAVVALFLIVALPSIIPPVMGADDMMGCWTNEDGCATENPILTSDVTRLVQIALDTIRGGGAIAIVVVGGIKGLQYRFIIPATQSTADESTKN